ncbi:MAG TPA: RDD family protein [Thermoanaerobaculia bacterium]|nr:RDD family protein [Thermoanaerobaculia bacterium]
MSDRDGPEDGLGAVPTFPPAAGFWRRAGSGAIDLLWIAPGVCFLGATLRQLVSWPVVTVLVVVVVLAVHAAMWRAWSATPGKALLGLRILGVDGRTIDDRQVLLRCAGYLLGVLTFGLGFAMAGLNASRRGLHDQAAGTYVAEARRLRRRKVAERRDCEPERARRSTGSAADPLDSAGWVLATPDGITGAAEGFSRVGSETMSVDTAAPATRSKSVSEARPRNQPRSPARRWLGLAGGALLGAVLLVGAYAKALDPLAFVEQIRGEGLDFLLPAAWVAAIALALEIFLGSALLLGIRRRWVLYPSALLVAFFLFLTGRTYARSLNGTLEEEAGCGCFGNLVERTPAEAFWQDAALLVPTLLLAFLALVSSGSFPRVRTAVVVALTGFGLGFAWMAPSLPLDDLATRLRPGVLVEEICSGRDEERICLGTIRPELLEGEHLVVIADLQDSDFGERVASLNAYRFEVGDVVVLSDAPAEEHRRFFWEWGPAFDIVEAPPALLSPLYRQRPRSFVVRDGEVVETFAGLPPLPESEGDDLLFAPTAETDAGSTEGTSP